VDWIHLADDGDKWRALLNTVMNLREITEMHVSAYIDAHSQSIWTNDIELYFLLVS
jgi:hypothetical protein